MDRRILRISFRIASIFCAICLCFARAHAADTEAFYGGGGPAISVAPVWESYKPESKPWTEYGAQVIDELGDDLLVGARDIQTFCPRYYKLRRDDRITAWLYIISAIVKYESYFNPVDRYEEKGMGKDGVTGRSVWSEGLMALSYQDSLKFPFCDEFDWHRDKKLKGTDPHKSILSPYKNLKCGIQILNDQIRRHQELAINDGAYWAVIMPRNSHNQLAKIRALTTTISICKTN